MNLDKIKFERVQEGLEVITLTRKQLTMLNDFKRIHVGDKFFNAMTVLSNYVGNRSPIWINRNSQVFKERRISYRQVTHCINWLESNEFIIKVKESNRFTKQCARYKPMTPGFFKWFRRYLESRNLFEYLFNDNYEPFLSTFYGHIDMSFIQSIQQLLNKQIFSVSRETYPLINFTIREKDQDFMLLYGNGSGRAYSDYANELNEDNNDCEDDISRQKILADKWKCKLEDIIEYDVRASIPKVARLMNYGIWESQNVDAYEILFKKFFESKGLEWNKYLRKDSKMLFMFLAFNFEISKIKRLNNINWRLQFNTDNKIPYLRKHFNKFSKEDIEILLKNLNDFCGKIPNNIFIIESCIYLCFLYVLKRKGYFPENKIEFIFDAIETCEEINKDDFDKILESVAYTFKNKFIEHTFKPVYTLQKVIDNLDYEQYNLMWNTTDNHFSEIFGNPDKLNEESIKILDKLFHFKGGLTKLYFKKGLEACKKKLELAMSRTVTSQDIERKQRDVTILNEIKQLLEENPTIKMKEIEEKLGISNKYRQKLMKML